MSIAARIRYLVREHGLKAVFVKLVGQAIDVWYEKRYGLDTLSVRAQHTLTVSHGSQAFGHDYEGSRVMPLRCLLPELQRLVAPNAALVDCGCGKGKVLLVAAECGIDQVRGIEFAQELCDIAEANWRKLQKKTAIRGTCEIICCDILAYEFRSNDSMLFLFNPFDASILKSLILNVLKSYRAHPRDIVIAIAFMDDAYANTMRSFSDFCELQPSVYWACRFSLFLLRHSDRGNGASGTLG